MPRLGELYPSKYLSAGDLTEQGMILTIRDVTIEKMRDGTEKPILHFDEIDKGLALNKTNANAIGKMYGDETDDWEDERISIYPTYTDFGGEQVECIRVKPKKPSVANQKPVKRAKGSPEAEAAIKAAGERGALAQDEDEGTPF